MSDPADKSDDLIAELAKLMATPPAGGKPGPQAVQPPPMPTTNGSAAPQPAPAGGIRIPGMDAPVARPAMAAMPQAANPAPAPQTEAPRAPVTGSIRIPGMDQPAPVSTSVPVGKFDFGAKPAPAAPIKQEPLSSLSERLAAGQATLIRESQAKPVAAEPPPLVRVPSSLTPVSENRSFAQGPALSVARPVPSPASAQSPTVSVAPQQAPSAPAPQSSGAPAGFSFDFGFGQSPAAAPMASPEPLSVEPPPRPANGEAFDPIAALIAAEMADAGPVEAEIEDEPDAEETPVATPNRPVMATVTPINRSPAGAQPVKMTMAPVSAGQAKPASTPIPLKPVSVAPRAPEADRFAISPGVGLNVKPQASQPLNAPVSRAPVPPVERDESDPMSEIESLIGEAVRVELSPGPVRVQTPQVISATVELEPEEDLEEEIHTHPGSAPVVPPLNSGFAPRRANLKEDAGANSAEAAILAAAAASGAEVGRVEPRLGDESPYRRLKVKPQRSSFLSGGMRQYVGMAVAGTLLLAAGLGLYWVLNMGRASTTGANAPQLTADVTPVKVKPAEASAPATDAAKSPVLAKMDGVSSAPSSEQLVSTDEATTGAVTRDVTPAGDGGDDTGLANRKVRTVTVRPDGTIVSGDDAVAGGEELPVERPNVPTVPSGEATNLLGNDATVAAADPTTTAPAATSPTLATPAPTTAADATTQVADVQPVIDPTAVAPTPMAFPVRSAATQPLALTAPPKNTSVNAVVTGAQTPNGQIDLLGGGQATPTQKVATTTPAPVSSSGAAAYVQLASQPTQADAQASLKGLQAKYGSLFGGTKLTIQQVDLGQKGIRWRIRLPAASLSSASSICAQVKAQGGDCFATNG